MKKDMEDAPRSSSDRDRDRRRGRDNDKDRDTWRDREKQRIESNKRRSKSHDQEEGSNHLVSPSSTALNRDAEKEKAFHRSRETDRDKEKDKDRDGGQSDKDKNKVRDRTTDKHRSSDRDREKGKDREREKGRDRDREGEKDRDRDKDRHRDRDRDRGKDRDRDKERNRDREKDKDRERGRDRDRESNLRSRGTRNEEKSDDWVGGAEGLTERPNINKDDRYNSRSSGFGSQVRNTTSNSLGRDPRVPTGDTGPPLVAAPRGPPPVRRTSKSERKKSNSNADFDGELSTLASKIDLSDLIGSGSESEEWKQDRPSRTPRIEFSDGEDDEYLNLANLTAKKNLHISNARDSDEENEAKDRDATPRASEKPSTKQESKETTDGVKGIHADDELTFQSRIPQKASDSSVGKTLDAAEEKESSNVTLDPMNPKPINAKSLPIFLRQLKTFLLKPFADGFGVQFRCFIERKKGLVNSLTPTYSLYADYEDGTGRLLLVAKKIFASSTPYYVISASREDLDKKRQDRSKSYYLGKLRGNKQGNEYVLYDAGIAPSDVKSEDVRTELAVITYNYEKSGSPFRKMEVCIPKIKGGRGNMQIETFKDSLNIADTMSGKFNQIRTQGKQNDLLKDQMYVMNLKESRYDPLSSCLVDFKGRATAASKKNFQLMESAPFGNKTTRNETDDVPISLQMGRVGNDCFNMDIQYPLSVIQAFGICLSRFDTKLNW